MKFFGAGVFMRIAISIAILVFLAGPIRAGALDNARAAYLKGNYDAALSVVTPAAEQGNPVAQNILGDAYDTGHGVRQDHATALEWWKRAADQEYPEAMYNLGRLSLNGAEGVPQDYLTAAEMFTALMQRNYPEAFTSYGLMLEEEVIDGATPEMAVETYQQGVDLGSIRSAYNLANMYREGRGVPEDMSRARALYRLAARGGLALGQNSLAAMYDAGLGGERDAVAAYALYRLALAGGLARAAYNLAFLSSESKGFWQDPVTAYAYCVKAIAMAKGEERAGFERDCSDLSEYLTPEDLAEAKARAASL